MFMFALLKSQNFRFNIFIENDEYNKNEILVAQENWGKGIVEIASIFKEFRL